MRCAQGVALTATLLFGRTLASVSHGGKAEYANANVKDAKGGKETCAADAKISQARHYALLQVTHVSDRLSFANLHSTEDHEEVPQQPVAQKLINLKVSQDPSANLTAFDLDYLQDASNPLDTGVATPAGGASGTSELAAASSNTKAKGDSTAKCCDGETVGCLACKAGLSVEAYCAEHTDKTGCEDTFDCAAGLERWEAGWSGIKKTYCCNKMQVGCASASSAATGGNASSSSSSSPSSSPSSSSSSAAASASASASAAAASAGAAPGQTTPPGACLTREDPRASSVGYTTSPPGTACIFGVDDRDEGQHCIMEDGKYGSFGWCWTDVGKSSWGACSESCPLFGPLKVLGGLVKSLKDKVEEALATTTTTTTTVTTTSTVTDSANTTSEENTTTTTQ